MLEGLEQDKKHARMKRQEIRAAAGQSRRQGREEEERKRLDYWLPEVYSASGVSGASGRKEAARLIPEADPNGPKKGLTRRGSPKWCSLVHT